MSIKSEKAAKAADIIRQYMFGSVATRMMPALPLLDHTLQSEVRLKLVNALAKHYEITAPSKRVRSLLDELVDIGPAGIAMKILKNVMMQTGNAEEIIQEAKAFLGESVNEGAVELASRLIKTVVPGARLILDFSDFVEPSATLYAVGQVFITHFEAGGTLEDFDASLVREQFEKELLIGRKIIEIRVCDGKSDRG